MPAALISVVLGLLGGSAMAQEGPPLEFDPVLELRARGNAGYTSGLSDGLITDRRLLTRSRVGQHLSRGEVEAEVAVQGYSAWLAVDGRPGDYELSAPILEVYRAWGSVALQLPGEVGAELSLGRQGMTLHQGRLVSEYEFSARGNPLDAVVFDLRASGFHWRVANIRDFNDPTSLDNPGTSLAVIGFDHQDPATAWVVDIVSILDSVEGETRTTAGYFADWERERLGLGSEAYVQSLERAEGTSAALLGAAWMQYTLGRERLLNLRLQADLLSSELGVETPGGFSTPLGDKFANQGHLGLFQDPEDTGFRGLSDVFLRATWRPRPDWELAAAVHHFGLLDTPVGLGEELDTRVRWAVSPVARVEAGVFVFWSRAGFDEVAPAGLEGEPMLATGFAQMTFGL